MTRQLWKSHLKSYTVDWSEEYGLVVSPSRPWRPKSHHGRRETARERHAVRTRRLQARRSAAAAIVWQHISFPASKYEDALDRWALRALLARAAANSAYSW